MSDVFAFRIIRGPQRHARANGIPLYPSRRNQPVPPSLRVAQFGNSVDTGASVSRYAELFIAGPSFITPRTPLPVPLRELDQWLTQRRNRAEPSDIVKSLPTPPAELIAAADWLTTRESLADSLIAAMIARHRDPSTYVHLHRLLMLAGLIEALAQTHSALQNADDVATFLRTAHVLLPSQLLDVMPTNARLARRYGFSELVVVRDDWFEYRFGEIAHVENALKGEIRERAHRRITETETIDTHEQERTTEESSDVQKTDRFEMSSHSNEQMSLKASVEATVDVSATYPSTTVDVHAGGSFDYSQEQAREQATELAQETIARAVKRVEDRVSTLRSTRTLERFEESNLHRFENNSATATTLVAVYRWIDKIQRLQAFHYPHRFLLELQIPEPAAFVHWRRKRPSGDFLNPAPPEFIALGIGITRALGPTDITPQTYLQYAQRYRIGDIEQPPPPTIVKSVPVVLAPPAGGANAQPDDLGSVADLTQYDLVGGGEGQSAGGSATVGVQVPDGYRLNSWSATIHTYTSRFVMGDVIGNSADAVVQVRGANPVFKVTVGQAIQSATPQANHNTASVPTGAWDSVNIYTAASSLLAMPTGLTGQVPVTVWARDAREFRAHLTMTCDRLPDALVAWQLRVFSRLAAEYRSQQVRHLEERAARAIGNGVQISGDSPTRNKEVMREELKRAAIRLLSNGTYPPSNLPEPNLDPEVGPEFDLDSAALSAPEIQFIEQAFEWENMTFVLYPYFWTGKGKWAELADIPDGADPQFARFLRSGSARVVVPARPGFEGQVQMYVDTGVIWGGGPVPAIDDPEYLSVAEEIRLQTGAGDKGEPGDWWDVRLPTSLVAVDLNAALPFQNPTVSVGPTAVAAPN
ncbi:hypothetical protein [Steroidobacter sp.]|uniref:hypothetical protein n=1 Tax=Steroidobacter sp. TaxID=1978227 RepID=UPI001A51F127|nr:hypothetical protein [Steroidobacter sp.]MBL8270920.1 hypothetical protein [Steroidobacter sp.]